MTLNFVTLTVNACTPAQRCSRMPDEPKANKSLGVPYTRMGHRMYGIEHLTADQERNKRAGVAGRHIVDNCVKRTVSMDMFKNKGLRRRWSLLTFLLSCCQFLVRKPGLVGYAEVDA